MPLKITKKKGSPNWYVRGTINGQEVCETTRTTDKAIAEKFKIKLEHDLTFENKPSRPTFSDACFIYLKQGGEDTFMEKIHETLGAYYLDEIDQALLDRKSREAYPTQKNSTVKRAFYDPFTAIRNCASKYDLIEYKKFSKPKCKRPAPEWVEIEWLEKFWKHCNPRLLALMTFMPYTGCRTIECVELTWDRVNLEEAWAYIPKTKNKEPRTVHLPKIVIERMKAIQKKDGRVFGYSNRHSVRNAVVRACKRAGIKYHKPHAIGSHTYATLMRRYNNMDAVGLVATGRWKDPRSTYIYAHARTTEEARKADNLPTTSIKSEIISENHV